MKEHLINPATCTNCERCIAVCPAMILTKDPSGNVCFNPDRISLCVYCGHCMAMCTSDAISITGIEDPGNFREMPASVPGHDELMNLMLTRRSVRFFKEKPVPREAVDKILEAVATAPYGVSADHLHITAVTDPALIREAVPEIAKVYVQLEKIMKVPLIGWLIRKSLPLEAKNTVSNFIMPHMAKGLYKGTGGVDDIARNAPALLLFHAHKGAEEHTVDAHIAITYAMLSAHAQGLGATIIGLIGPGINQSRKLRQRFQIPESNEVVETLILGYPKMHFHRAIIRPRKNVMVIG